MKQIILSLIGLLFISMSVQAQKTTDKVVLTKDQKINMITEMKSDMTRAQQGNMKTDMVLASDLVVKEITDKGYVLEATMRRAKMKIESAMFNADYDSEDEEKKKGRMGAGFEKALNNTETITLGFDGKVIKDPAAKDDQEGRMMRMMGGGDIATTIESGFLLLPADLEVGKKWRTTTENDGLVVITEYTYQGMMGNMANITANQQSKGEVAGGRAGAFMMNVNQLTQMTIMVDVNTGLISMKTMETTDNSSTEMGGETYKSTGTTNMTITFD